MKKIAIVGFGRFGRLLAELTKNSFDVWIVESDKTAAAAAREQGFSLLPFEQLGEVEAIFLAVPISALEDVLQKLAPLVGEQQVVIDLCSVKVHPAELMQKYLPHSQTLASHPLFGPDSARHGLEGLRIVLCPLNISDENLQIIKDFWQQKGVEVIQETPEAHDRDVIYSLGLTHILSRLIEGMHIPDLTFTTKSFRALKEVAELSANDTEQLFHDMLYYNPYLSAMREQLHAATVKAFAAVDRIADEQRG